MWAGSPNGWHQLRWSGMTELRSRGRWVVWMASVVTAVPHPAVNLSESWWAHKKQQSAALKSVLQHPACGCFTHNVCDLRHANMNDKAILKVVRSVGKWNWMCFSEGVFYMTLSVSHIIAKEFWPTLLHNVALDHQVILSFSCAQLSHGSATAFKLNGIWTSWLDNSNVQLFFSHSVIDLLLCKYTEKENNGFLLVTIEKNNCSALF